MTEIDIMMKSFVSHAYSDLQTEFVVFSVAAFVLYFVAPLVIVRLMSRYYKKSYFFKGTTDKILHYIFLGVLVLDGIRAVFANTTALVPHGMVISVCVLFLILSAVIQLWRWRPSGIILAYAAVLAFAIFKNWVWVTIVYQEDLNSYSLLGTYEIYVHYDYFLFSGIMLSLATVILASLNILSANECT